MSEIHVYLVDDNAAFNESTAWALEDEGLAVSCFGSAIEFLESEKESLKATCKNRCVVSDIRMPEMSGMELIDQLWQHRIRVPVILISAHADVPLAVEAMQRGAAHVVEKPFNAEVLAAAVRVTVDQPLSRPRNLGAARERLAKLTPREREVLELVCAGLLNKTIADRLGIHIKTVERHRASLLSKLEVNNIQDLMHLSMGYI